jgi:hypothetical protein
MAAQIQREYMAMRAIKNIDWGAASAKDTPGHYAQKHAAEAKAKAEAEAEAPPSTPTLKQPPAVDVDSPVSIMN